MTYEILKQWLARYGTEEISEDIINRTATKKQLEKLLAEGFLTVKMYSTCDLNRRGGYTNFRNIARYTVNQK